MIRNELKKLTFEDKFARHYGGKRVRLWTARFDKRKNKRFYRRFNKRLCLEEDDFE